MKKLLLMLLACLMILPAAQAEIYYNTEVPQDWYTRPILRLTAIDVNRSDAMLLECGGEAMLVDGGSGPERDKLFAAVDQAGVSRFKYLFSTHSDNDHIHGLKYLMETGKYQVDLFTSPNKTSYADSAGYHQMTMKVINRMHIPYHQVEDGEVLTLGDAKLTVMRCMKNWGANNRSAVLMVQLGDSRVLLTGDIDNKTMRHYVEKYGADALKADILKTPHHGIATIPDEFRNAVNPEMIFITNMQEKTSKFNANLKGRAPEIKLLYSGDAAIYMETDGTDWYVWQKLPEEK